MDTYNVRDYNKQNDSIRGTCTNKYNVRSFKKTHVKITKQPECRDEMLNPIKYKILNRKLRCPQ